MRRDWRREERRATREGQVVGTGKKKIEVLSAVSALVGHTPFFTEKIPVFFWPESRAPAEISSAHIEANSSHVYFKRISASILGVSFLAVIAE